MDDRKATTDYLWRKAEEEGDLEQLAAYREVSRSIREAAAQPQKEKKIKIPQVPLNIKKTQTHVDGADDFMLPTERRKAFYETGQVYQLGSIEIKLAYDEMAGSNFIYWVKNNDFNPELRSTHMKASVFEIDLLLPKLKQLIDEIRNVGSRNSIIPFLEGDSLSVEHRNSESYWSPDFTLQTPSRNLLVRPYQHENGTYRFILLNPRKIRAKTSAIKWLGASHTLQFGEMIAFISTMEQLCNKAYEMEIEKEQKISDEQGMGFDTDTANNLFPDVF